DDADAENGDSGTGDTGSGGTESNDTGSDNTDSSEAEDADIADTAEEAAQSTVSLTNLSYSATSLKSRSLTGSAAKSSATSYTLLSSTGATGDTDETDAEQNNEEDTAQDSESTVNVVVDPDALSELLTALTEDFTSYLEENGLGFTDYLSSDTASQILMSGLMSMIDTTELENQLTSAIEAAITDMMTELMNVIAQAIEEQMTEIMEELMEAIEEEITEVMTEMMTEIMDEVMDSIETAMTQMMEDMTDSLETAFEIDSDVLAEAFQFNLDSESLAEIMTSLSSSTSYDSNLETFGYLDFANPSEIDIYPKDFKSKDVVIDILDAYNQRMEDEGKSEQVITYTDTVGLLMSSVTTIIDVISYVLIAFVSVSLIVSSIMIGIITYISVLERTREIGILRAIGASKNNISQIFNAETLIVGFCAGMIGIGVSYALLVPINYLIHRFAGTTDVSAVLMPQYAAILVVLSMVLTLIGGLIPSASAAKKDPVTALRTD
ncbi:MAG: FtsX-like permease family protein, partial [Lachnospiraceae bacterium]|nr:FtsX-like permease family protein [Lachnospiraceae bacterium]